MKKLVIAIMAVLAIFTFIREYNAINPPSVEEAHTMTSILK